MIKRLSNGKRIVANYVITNITVFKYKHTKVNTAIEIRPPVKFVYSFELWMEPGDCDDLKTLKHCLVLI